MDVAAFVIPSGDNVVQSSSSGKLACVGGPSWTFPVLSGLGPPGGVWADATHAYAIFGASGNASTLRRYSCTDGNAAPQEMHVQTGESVLGVDAMNVYFTSGEPANQRVTAMKNDLSGTESEVRNKNVGGEPFPASVGLLALTVAPEGTYFYSEPVVVLVPSNGTAPRAVFSAYRTAVQASGAAVSALSVNNRTIYIRTNSNKVSGGGGNYLYKVALP